MNRKSRRSIPKKGKPTPGFGANQWGQWEEINWRRESVSMGVPAPKHLTHVWKNNLYIVQLFLLPSKQIGEIQRLMIRRNDAAPNVSWAEKQRIKNELIGPHAIAVEAYPPVEYLVDDANMYWLWLLPADVKYPFLETPEDWQ